MNRMDLNFKQIIQHLSVITFVFVHSNGSLGEIILPKFTELHYIIEKRKSRNKVLFIAIKIIILYRINDEIVSSIRLNFECYTNKKETVIIFTLNFLGKKINK